MSAAAPAMLGRVEPGPRVAIGEKARDVATAPAYKWLVTRRLDLSLLAWWQRPLYRLLVRRLGLPPKPPSVRGLFDSRAEAVAFCCTRDDQIQMIPYGWAYGIELDELQGYCRPLDPLFRAQNEREAKLYADPNATPTPFGDPSLAHLGELICLLERIVGQLHALRLSTEGDASSWRKSATSSGRS